MRPFRYFALLVCALSISACSTLPNASENKRPNILFILADDLGYADLGYLGSEIPTPTLDSLANNGLILTDFYANMACSPTRAMLMSGTDSHLAGLGAMHASRADHVGQPGYEAYLNDRVASLADLMTDAGYNTYMTGKWHLGHDVETGPKARGFKRSFASMDGAAHLSGLSWDGPDLAQYRDGDKLVTVDGDFYTTRFYTKQMIEYIEQDREDGKPFFAYLAYTAPHWPLQAPEESIAKFKGMYDDGYEALYKDRFASMQAIGQLPDGALPDNDALWKPRWNSLSAEEQKIESRKMEIYAAMVSDMDTYIAEVLDYLESIGELDNTFIMFMSDNGVEGLRRDLQAPLSDWVASCCNNSYENLGKGDSYVMYGPNWANTGAIPFNQHKTTGFDGGIHVPAFVHYPKMVTPGTQNDSFGTVMDLLPTFLELAESEHPGTRYRGSEVLPVKGKSLLPMLTNKTTYTHDEKEYTGWELHGHRSIRQGDWKIVWDNNLKKPDWALFNIVKDPSERNNLAATNPEKLAQMIGLWGRYEKENGVIY